MGNKREPRVLGILKSYVEENAKPGESYYQAAARLKRNQIREGKENEARRVQRKDYKFWQDNDK